jgi:hypothetical protein
MSSVPRLMLMVFINFENRRRPRNDLNEEIPVILEFLVCKETPSTMPKPVIAHFDAALILHASCLLQWAGWLVPMQYSSGTAPQAKGGPEREVSSSLPHDGYPAPNRSLFYISSQSNLYDFVFITWLTYLSLNGV